MSSWSCSKCTFLNPPSQTLACEICLSPFPSSSVVTTAANAANWLCSACTFSNSAALSFCLMCGTKGPSFPDPELVKVITSATASCPPLHPCGTKRAAEAEADVAEGSSRSEKSKRKDLETQGDGERGAVEGRLKVLSYNVWFREDLELHERMKALGGLIQEHLPDFICLQEVTPDIYEIFQSSKWWKNYKCSVSQELAIARPYFCMQMSKLPVKSFRRKPFANSIMGRELSIAEIDVGMDKKLVIATSHLESPSPAPPKWDQMYSKERVSQAKESVELLRDFPNAIFGGDMNWDDKLDGAFPLTDGWVDAWVQLRPGESGFTYDTKSNEMLTGNRTLQKRLDRFLCNLKDFKIEKIEMIGREAIPGISYCKEKKVRKEVKQLVLPVLPSDHYGLLLTIHSI